MTSYLWRTALVNLLLQSILGHFIDFKYEKNWNSIDFKYEGNGLITSFIEERIRSTNFLDYFDNYVDLNKFLFSILEFYLNKIKNLQLNWTEILKAVFVWWQFSFLSYFQLNENSHYQVKKNCIYFFDGTTIHNLCKNGLNLSEYRREVFLINDTEEPRYK